jgi:dihydrofolate reductase
MRKVFLHINISLDGFIEDDKHEMDWHFVDDEFEEYIKEVLRSIDGMIFGRVAHQLLAEYWPTAASKPGASPRDVETATMMNTLPKYVISRESYQTEWQNSHIISGDVAGEIRNLKDEPGKDIALFAGAGVARSFMQLDLLDEYRLILNPVVLGRGTPLFRNGNDKRNLELLETLRFSSGAMVLTYKPEGRA